MQQSTYAISGGKEGKSRLNILAAAMQPYTQAWLMKAGITAASNFLDAGCGGGNVALLVTKLAGKKCGVTGIDFDNEILKLAREDALKENVHNIQYLHRNIFEIDFEDEFDFVYARFLLSHLQDPLVALLKMKEASTVGGKIIAEDIQFSRHFSYPFNAAFDHYLKLYPEIVKRRGGNAELGVLLPGLFTDAGIKIIAMDVIQPVFISGEGKQIAYETMDKIKNPLIEERIENAETINKILQDLKKFTEDNDSLISFPAICRITGVKN
jgi:SAM-dependent methyltransferase